MNRFENFLQSDEHNSSHKKSRHSSASDAEGGKPDKDSPVQKKAQMPPQFPQPGGLKAEED